MEDVRSQGVSDAVARSQHHEVLAEATSITVVLAEVNSCDDDLALEKAT